MATHTLAILERTDSTVTCISAATIPSTLFREIVEASGDCRLHLGLFCLQQLDVSTAERRRLRIPPSVVLDSRDGRGNTERIRATATAGRKLTAESQQLILHLKHQGLSDRELAVRFHVGTSTVRRLLQQYAPKLRLASARSSKWRESESEA
jgi:hypothetical protein